MSSALTRRTLLHGAGALIVSLTNIGLSGLTKRPPGPPSKPPPAKRGDVIDI